MALAPKKLASHRRIMVLLFTGGLLAAGLFAFMPGHVMPDALF